MGCGEGPQGALQEAVLGPAGSQALGWVRENTLGFSPKGLVSTQDASGAMLGTGGAAETASGPALRPGRGSDIYTHTVTSCGTCQEN